MIMFIQDTKELIFYFIFFTWQPWLAEASAAPLAADHLDVFKASSI